MIARLRHGLVLGAALGALLLTIEIAAYGAPLRGTAEAAGWMPGYVAAGALLGMLAALSGLPRAVRSGRERATGIQIFATALGFGMIAFAWLPHWLAGSEGLLMRGVLAFGFAAALHLFGLAAAASSKAWLFASFTAPLTATVALLFLSISALLARGFLPHDAEESTAPLVPPHASVPQMPHLLLVVLEGVRADRLGCYGSFRATTPYLDSLAQESVLFEQAFATSSEHAASMTGMLQGGRLATELAARGYQTWAGSGGGVGDPEDGRILADFGNREDARKPRPASRLLLARGVAAARGKGLRPEHGGDSELVSRALVWLQARDTSRPFAMVLHLGETGPPYDPPREYRERFRPDDVGAPRFEELRNTQNEEWFRRAETGERTVGLEESRSLSALQDAELLAEDGRIQRLVEGLRAADLLERTLLVVTSDHGSRFGEDGGRLGHTGSAHDAVLRVPLITRMPQRLPAATRARGLISLADLTPGVLAALDGINGSALERAASGELPHSSISAELRVAGENYRVLRTTREKFLLGADGSLVAAGDLLADPDESFLRLPWSVDVEVANAAQLRVQALLRERAESAGN